MFVTHVKNMLHVHVLKSYKKNYLVDTHKQGDRLHQLLSYVRLSEI